MSREIYFWQNMPAFHQSALLQSLARVPGVKVVLVTESALTSNRRRMGWPEASFEGCEVIAEPSFERRSAILQAQPTGAINIFSGVSAYAATSKTLKMATAMNKSLVVYVEPIRGDQWFSSLRYLRLGVQGLRLRRKIAAVLATGQTAVNQYRAVYGGARVYDFGYFVDPTVDEPIAQLDAAPASSCYAPRVRVVFVGSLTRRKRFDMAIRALAHNKELPWELVVYGDGPERRDLVELSTRLGIAEHVQWRGFLPNDELRQALFRADLLVIPSSFDGWGVVVNEALHAGVRVVASSAVGARDLVESSGHGVVTPPRVGALAQALQQMLRRGPVTLEQRMAVREWASAAIGGEPVASYLLAVLEHSHGSSPVRPTPPWRAIPPPSSRHVPTGSS